MLLRIVIGCLAICAGVESLSAQEAKQVRTKKDTAVALLNLLNAKPDCTSSMNPVALPVLRNKPSSGAVQMIVGVANIGASTSCPARKVPVITLIYAPKPGFTGSDAVTVEIDGGNKATLLSYGIIVQSPGDAL